ncbi:MAG: hypothetical protein NTX79_06695 [Candidatus Micrarchaeota archaeon]|nr:hypothetical protein [Candidatus Micrarchaeota archaeon]
MTKASKNPQNINQSNQKEASARYCQGREFAKEGGASLFEARKKIKAGNLVEARECLGDSIANFNRADREYELALSFVQTWKFGVKITTKKHGLNVCDLAFAKKALAKIVPQIEPPMKNEVPAFPVSMKAHDFCRRSPEPGSRIIGFSF